MDATLTGTDASSEKCFSDFRSADGTERNKMNTEFTTIEVYVHVSPENAIKGDGRWGTIPVKITFDSNSNYYREILSKMVKQIGDRIVLHKINVSQYDGNIYEDKNILSLTSATQEAIFDFVNQIRNSSNVVKARLADKNEKEKAEIERRIELVKTCKPSDFITEDFGITYPKHLNLDYLNIKTSTMSILELSGMLPSVEEELKRMKKEKAELDKRLYEEAQKEKEEKVNSLRQWALENGSPRLKALIEEGFSWISVAENEFINKNIPGLYVSENDFDETHGDVCIKKRTKPELYEIDHLREMRGRCENSNGVLSNPTLIWVESKIDDELKKFPVLRINMNLPNGKVVNCYGDLTILQNG